MFDCTRPYLVIPKLIQQKTWGGDYIVDTKKIKKSEIISIPIGQSYELFSGTKLSLANVSGEYEVGQADSDAVVGDNFSESENKFITLGNLIGEQPVEVLGKSTTTENLGMNLLLKLTQAKGNSFQIHIKPSVEDKRWLPKSETWYFFEKGKVSCGIRNGISIKDYMEACKQIEVEMKKLSEMVKSTSMLVEEARATAKKIVNEVNPWQFVRVMNTTSGEIFDMSQGGIHHSWEEDIDNPMGNILYEVQQDRMDPVSTIRAFDQGKISDSGEVREINIDDYFKYLDTNEEVNSAKKSGISLGGNNLFTTKEYATDKIEIDRATIDTTNNSFGHFFIKEGVVGLETDGGMVEVREGWSCFVPAKVASKVRINPTKNKAVILKTYVPRN